MIFYVNNKEYNLDYTKMQKNFISSGYESDVYKIDDKVFKFYKEICLKYRLNEEMVNYLSKIKTNRILLPQDIIYDEYNNFFGYTMKYIKPNIKDEIGNIKIEKLLKELLCIKKDLILLKDNNIFIDDLCDSNFIFNNGIYLIDPGSFELDKNKSKDYIEIINMEMMQDFIIRYILFRYKKLSYKEKNELNKYFPLDKYMYDSIKSDIINKKETIYEYSNRIINKL